MDSLPLALYVLVLLIPALAVLMAPGSPGAAAAAAKSAIDEVDDKTRRHLRSAIAQLAASGLPRRRIRSIAADELRFLTKGI